jgi:uncharacterized protein (TIGR03437 family)
MRLFSSGRLCKLFGVIVICTSSASAQGIITTVAGSGGNGSFSGDGGPATQNGKGAGAITHVDGSPVSQQNPAQPGEEVILYATGLGKVTPSVPTGELPGGASATVAAATLTIDGLTVIPDFAGLAGCCVGLNQVNVRLPANTRSASDVPLVLDIGATESNPVTIAVQ